MQQTLWGKQIPRRRRKKNVNLLNSTTPYAVTENDCEILGHTLREWDLAGCTTCLDCNIKIFCPTCISAHPQDAKAIPILCNRHEERTVSA